MGVQGSQGRPLSLDGTVLVKISGSGLCDGCSDGLQEKRARSLHHSPSVASLVTQGRIAKTHCYESLLVFRARKVARYHSTEIIYLCVTIVFLRTQSEPFSMITNSLNALSTTRPKYEPNVRQE